MPRIVQLFPSGNSVWIGKNACDNERLTWDEENDLEWWWFHAHDVPGSHVVIKGQKVPSAEEMDVAAAWAAHRSKAAAAQGRVPVTCTQLKHLRKDKKDPVGMVYVKGPYRILWATAPFIVVQ
jgi:predicted ribosome quality control (RQC) complex YloA/Tae2 family protein